MSAGIKLVSDRIPVGEIVFFRSFFMLLPLMIWLGWQGHVRAALRTKNVLGHFRRSVMTSSSMFLNFLALAYLPLSNAVAFGYTAPLILIVLAAIVLHEKVQAYRWIAAGVGFTGVLVMLGPQVFGAGASDLTGVASIGVAIALVGAVMTAGALVEVRRLVATETTGAIIFYMAIITSMLGLVTILGGWVMPTAEEAGILIAVGVLGGVGQILLTLSLRYGDASLIAPFEYTTMIWACLIGWFIFGDWPAPAVFAGSGIVIAAGIYMIWRERASVSHATLTPAAIEIPLLPAPAPAAVPSHADRGIDSAPENVVSVVKALSSKMDAGLLEESALSQKDAEFRRFNDASKSSSAEQGGGPGAAVVQPVSQPVRTA